MGSSDSWPYFPPAMAFLASVESRIAFLAHPSDVGDLCACWLKRKGGGIPIAPGNVLDFASLTASAVSQKKKRPQRLNQAPGK